MTDVYTFLSLPKTSAAFSALPNFAPAEVKSSSSPPRKIARLHNAASTSSSRLAAAGGTAEARGPILLRVVGPPVKSHSELANDAEFQLLRSAIRVLLNRKETQPLPATYDRLQRACRAAVGEAGKGEGVYETVKMELERCIGVLKRELAESSSRGLAWLVPFTETCAWFDKQVGLLRSILAFLDTSYISERTHLRKVKDLADGMFSDAVIRSAQVSDGIIKGIEEWLNWERSTGGEHAKRTTIIRLVDQLNAHGHYKDVFEATYIDLTHLYYSNESDTKAAELKDRSTEFLVHCRRRQNEEMDRVGKVLLEPSRELAVHMTVSSLLAGRLEWLAEFALADLIKNRNTGDLKAIYRLFANVGGLKVLSASWKLFIQTEVKNIVTDAERDEDMVPRLLDLRSFADSVVETCFVDEIVPVQPPRPAASEASSSRLPPPVPARYQQNKDFAYGLIDAFQAGFKARRNKPAEMIAKYMDRAMRRGQKGRKDEDFQAELDAALGLYRFTDDMDVFRTFYHRALAKRLLLGRSASDDFEKAVLKKLKENYDPEFGMGDHMFTDLALSRDIMNEYTSSLRNRGKDPEQKLGVMVLQRSVWPFTTRTTDVFLPTWMQDSLSAYTEYYKRKYPNRRLDWDHALGTATLKARFKSGVKELSVSLYQAVILLLFNEENVLSYRDIKRATGFKDDDAELKRTLQSLACGKKRVLRKEPPGKDVDDTDMFHYNADFTDPRIQVHINSIQSKETPEESKKTQTSIDMDRRHALDAAIVRVMKARKELSHQQLTTATVEAVKNHFVPEVSMIKKRIEGLVEQEYLRRDEDDANKYIYVA